MSRGKRTPPPPYDGPRLTLKELRLWIKANHPNKVESKRLREMWSRRATTTSDSLRLRREMIRWCIEHFGKTQVPICKCINLRERPIINRSGFPDPALAIYSYDPEAVWCHLGSNFHFRDPNSAFHFKMRWG